jgi:hypothetical protein
MPFLPVQPTCYVLEPRWKKPYKHLSSRWMRR